jgi:GNAT superfamily N-acetyltransferase
MQFIQAQSPEQIQCARTLFEEYAGWLGISLCFQNFAAELAGLPGDYQPPRGRLLLAFAEEELAGCIAMRDLGADCCEMKRLYLRPEFQGKGLGKELVQRIIEEARIVGYQRMRLDTLPPKMNRAIALYQALGFKEIAPYYPNPVPGATFMELAL